MESVIRYPVSGLWNDQSVLSVVSIGFHRSVSKPLYVLERPASILVRVERRESISRQADGFRRADFDWRRISDPVGFDVGLKTELGKRRISSTLSFLIKRSNSVMYMP